MFSHHHQSMFWLTLLLSAFAAVAFVVPPPTFQHNKAASPPMSSSTLLRDSEKDNSGAAKPLPLTASDLSRLAAVKSRHLTIPIMIMDAMLPGQSISFESADPKFHNLVDYVLTEGNHNEIGMIGFNPHTGRPLNIGVTLEVTPDCIQRSSSKNKNKKEQGVVLTLTCQAKRQFEVQGEPWLHNEYETGTNNPRASQSSFYLADIEIVNGRPEEAMSDEMAQVAQNLSNQIPDMVETWVKLMMKQQTHKNALGMQARMMELGPLPEEFKDRALWVAALLNPTNSASSTSGRVCLEIRPAMLACKNDHDRMVLATAALQSSIDHLTGEKRLF